MGSLAPRFLVSLALLANLVGAYNPVWNGRRHTLPPLVRTVEQNVTARSLEKRFDGARFTYYDAGLGACGRFNSGSDFIVALNAAQYAGGSHCFETITITANGKTASAQIVDLCPGCPFAGLDFSRGLFDFFASESVGVLEGSWNFGGGAPVQPSPPKITPTPPSPQPTTEHSVPTSTPPTTTYISTNSAASSSAAPIPASNSGIAAPATSSVPATRQINNLEQIYLAFIQIGGIALSGGTGSASFAPLSN